MIKNKGSTAESSSGQLVESCMQYDFSVAQNDSGKREKWLKIYSNCSTVVTVSVEVTESGEDIYTYK